MSGASSCWCGSACPSTKAPVAWCKRCLRGASAASGKRSCSCCARAVVFRLRGCFCPRARGRRDRGCGATAASASIIKKPARSARTSIKYSHHPSHPIKCTFRLSSAALLSALLNPNKTMFLGCFSADVQFSAVSIPFDLYILEMSKSKTQKSLFHKSKPSERASAGYQWTDQHFL